MTIKEAKEYLSNYRYDNEVREAINVLLEYVRYLENNYAKVKEANEAHRGLTGNLYKKIDER